MAKTAKSAKVTKEVKKPKKSLSKATAKTKKFLKKEVDLPLSQPKGRVGKFFAKKRRIRAPKYFRDSWKEVRKVNWPKRKEAIKLTLAVITFTLIFALFTSLIDYGFSQLVERIFL